MRTATRFVGIGWVGAALIALVACGGDKGDKGDPGAPGAAGASGAAGANGTNGAGSSVFQVIEPRVGLLAREVDVTLSAIGASFDASTTVDLGDPGITVSNVQVVSPSTLYAHLKIDATATLGAHDVTVGALKGTKAFEVKPDVDFAVTAGDAKQASLVQINFHNNDSDNAFDTGSSPDPSNPFGTIPNFQVTAAGAALFSMNSLTANEGQVILLLAPGTKAGPLAFSTVNVPNGVTMTKYLGDPNQITVAARTPTAVALPGALVGEKLGKGLASNFYEATSTGVGIFSWTVKPAAKGNLLADVIVFPPSGTLENWIGFGQAQNPGDPVVRSFPVATGSVDAQVMVFDGAGGGGAAYDYDLAVEMTPVKAVTAEAKPAANAHKTPQTAQALTLPAVVTGSIAADGEVDAYAVTIPASTTVEFTLTGEAGALAAFPADQSGLAIQPPSLFGGGDTTAQGGQGAFVDTQTFTQAASPSSTTMYFVVSGNSNATSQQGAYTFSLRARK